MAKTCYTQEMQIADILSAIERIEKGVDDLIFALNDLQHEVHCLDGAVDKVVAEVQVVAKDVNDLANREKGGPTRALSD